VSLNGSSTIAWRHNDEYSNGYVFVNDPIRFDERIVVQILATENMYMGSLAFGLTSVDPSTLDPDSLPEDSDMLLDRPEYWVVSKDVANSPDEGDELSFSVKLDGAVQFSKNGNVPSIFMHVDNNIDLWAFWDVYGNTQKLRLVGATKDPVIRPDQLRQNSNASLENDRNNLSMSDLLQDATDLDSGRLSSLPPIPPPRRSQSSHALPPPPPVPRNCRQEQESADTSTSKPPPAEPAESSSTSATVAESSTSSRNRNTDSRNGTDECKICYENIVDCVLYACGHMCLCYECALQQWKGRGGGICPMCRNYIQDVIKIYKS
jgi:protein neuralized